MVARQRNIITIYAKNPLIFKSRVFWGYSFKESKSGKAN
jgi:hypothetical protein